MRFVTLGSGSKGNATVVQTRRTTVMADCGFSMREAAERLAAVGLSPYDLDGIVTTHEHGDHIRGAGALARRYFLPVWASAGTGRHIGKGVAFTQVNAHRSFQIGDLEITPVPVPHDAKEPCQYVFRAEGVSFGLLTDLGHVTAEVIAAYRDCDALLLEFNHDRGMLLSGEYPPWLKARVDSDVGHLNNAQSCGLLKAILPGRLRYVTAAHLSEANNTTDIVTAALKETLAGHDCGFSIAAQHEASDWRPIAGAVREPPAAQH